MELLHFFRIKYLLKYYLHIFYSYIQLIFQVLITNKLMHKTTFSKYLYFLIISILPLQIFAQKDYNIKFKTEELNPEANFWEAELTSAEFQNSRFAGNYYLLLQFFETPNASKRQELEHLGVEFMGYIPEKTYIVSISDNISKNGLASFGIRAILPYKPTYKLSPQVLRQEVPEHAQIGDKVRLELFFFPNVKVTDIQEYLQRNFQTQFLETSLVKLNRITIEIPLTQVKQLAQAPWVEAIDFMSPKDVLYNYQGRNKHGVNYLFSTRGLDGTGVAVGVGDGGYVAPHTDLTPRIINKSGSIISGFGNHGDHVAGTVGGNGNKNPIHAGMAPKATIITNQASAIWSNTDDYWADHHMIGSNNSYGTSAVCSGGDYVSDSRSLDQIMNTYPYVLHAFAASNDGSDVCSPYSSGYNTVPDGDQVAKNVLTVGALSANNFTGLAGFSSRGPAGDGRVKPEICAAGTGVTSTVPTNNYGTKQGTSMANPHITGMITLLYQRYRQLNSGADPEAALVKALMCNSADDLGNSQVDYRYGYGGVNMRRALEDMEAGNYLSATVDNGNTNTHNIVVPAGTTGLRVMLYWSDPHASSGANPALVNNLDVRVIDPSATTWLPWVLDADPANVGNNAVRAVDNLNNIEQVTMWNSAGLTTGTYTIEVEGFDVPMGPQKYYIVYEFRQPQITVLFPNGGENLVPGEKVQTYFDTNGLSNNLTLQYSTDEGATWTNLNTNYNKNNKRYQWTVPSVSTSKARFRVAENSGGVSDESDANFTILGVPSNLNVVTACVGYAEVSWDAVTGASEYEVMQIVNGEMQTVATTTGTSEIIGGLDSSTEYWFSVRAKHADGGYSRRAIAASVTPSSGTCSWNNDLAIIEIVSPIESGREFTSSGFTATHDIIIKIRNVGANDLTGFDLNYRINGGSTITETYAGTLTSGTEENYTFTTQADLSATGATYSIEAWISHAGDTHNENDDLDNPIVVKHLANPPITSIPFIEDFETTTNQSYTTDQFGLDGLDRGDYKVDVDGAGRVSTEMGTGFPFSGTKAITLDNPGGNSTNKVDLTFNLSTITSSSLTFDIQCMQHGDENHAEDRIFIRGSDTDTWIEVYDWESNSSSGSYTLFEGLDISGTLASNSQSLSSSFQIRLQQYDNAEATSISGLDGVTFDDIRIYDRGEDVAVLSINNPSAGGCGMGVENISVEVRNTTAATITNIPIKYQVNGGTIITENITNIAASTTITHVFGTSYDFSASGTYDLKIWVDLGTDGLSSNDEQNLNFASRPLINTFPYQESFESDNGNWTSNATFGTNSWAWGTPSGTNINAASDGTKAWVTNLSGTTSMEQSYIESPCFDLTGFTNDPIFEFDIIKELPDVFNDRAFVSYSEDGTTWTTLGNTSSGTNWYSMSNYWTGEETWQTVAHSIPLSSITDLSNVRFRINLSTFSGNNIEGIGVDNLKIYDAGEDLELTSVSVPNSACGLSSTETISVEIKNNTSSTITNFDVKYQINGGTIVTETISSLAGNTTTTHNFTTTADLSSIGTYDIDCWIEHSSDNFTFNNRKDDNIVINQSIITVNANTPYHEGFESGSGGWVSSGTNATWALGTPNSGNTTINQAANGNNAWVTNLNGNHSADEVSYINSVCFDLSGFTSNPIISMNFIKDIEDTWDGAWLEYSEDGTTWTKLGTMSSSGHNWYNFDNTNNGLGDVWDGTHSEWHVVSHEIPLSSMTNKTQVKFRVAFWSDCCVHQEGIGIDDIHIYENTNIYPSSDVMVSETSTGAGWLHFKNGGDWVVSIHDDGNTLGNVEVDVYFNTSGTVREHNGKKYLDRNFRINPTNTPTGNYKIRLYFLETEFDALQSAEASFLMMNTIGMTKYSGSNENSDPTDNDITSANWHYKNASDISFVPFQNGYYAEFEITDFSELFLGGDISPASGGLPITLLNFKGKRQDRENVILNWTTATEINNAGFEIEMSEDGQNFEQVDFVEGVGNSTEINNYKLIINNSNAGYYRLKQVDFDGSFEYSNIVFVNGTSRESFVRIYPNPLNDDDKLKIDADLQEFTIIVSDARGMKLFEAKGSKEALEQSLNQSFKEYANGLYILQIMAKNDIQTLKLMKK